MKRIVMKQGDLRPERIVTLRGPTDGTSDLTTLDTVRLRAKRTRAADSAPLYIDKSLDILSTTTSTATVKLAWASGDTATPGTYLCELRCLDDDGAQITFPNGDDGAGGLTEGHFILQINPAFTP